MRTLRVALLVLPALVAAGCGDDERPEPPRDARVLERSVPWEVVAIDGRRLTLRYEAGTCAGQRLTVRPRVEEGPDAVTIAVVAARRVEGRGVCAGLVRIGRVTARLDEPLEDRALLHAEVTEGGAGRARPQGPFECPRRGGADPPLESRRLIGLGLGAARALASGHGCTVRVVERDGRILPHTQDLRPDRVNVGVRGRTIVFVDGVY